MIRNVLLVFVGCSLLFIVMLSALMVFLPNKVLEVSLSQIPSLVGKEVIVQGKLYVHMEYIPEEIPPYNCALQNASGVGDTIGIDWKSPQDDFEGLNVTIVGFVRLGYTGGLWAGTPEYFVEALTVEKS